MGCVYSNGANSRNRLSDASNAPRDNDGNSGVPLATNTRCRIFDVCNVDSQRNETIPGKIEITDNELILRLKESPQISWPLKYLRKYGFNNNLFSFECGRRCSTGPAIYAFKCSNAEQLFQTLIEVINNTLTSSALNGVNNGGNIQNSHASHLQNPSPNSRSPLNSLNAHEYQNLASFEGDNSMLRTLPADDFRSHSAMGSDHHTYLNSASTNVIGIKSQPNYYTSNPLSYNSPQFFGSKNCLSTNSGSRSPGFFTNFDSSTLPSMRSANFYHEYVNSNVCTGSQDDTCLSRRKNSESFDSRNNSYVNTANVMEVMRPKIANSDDFCFVNIDLDARRDKGMKSRSTRTTPEPYIQLDLQTTKTEEPKSEKGNSSKVTANGEKKKVIQESTSSKGDIGKSSSSTNSKQPKSSTEQKDSKSDGTKSNANISYAQIDFARTIALSNSAASHRKL